MTSPKLQMLERKFARQNPEQAPAPASDDLAAAIERMVQERVEQALEQRPVKPPAHVQRLLDQQNKPAPVNDFRPPARKPPAWIESTVTRRDHLGRIMWIDTTAEGSDLVLRTEVMSRNELGQICRSRTAPLPADQALPALPYEAEGRHYRDAVPRKLFGNDEGA